MSKTALITGINGMDGSHLADFLLEKGLVYLGIFSVFINIHLLSMAARSTGLFYASSLILAAILMR